MQSDRHGKISERAYHIWVEEDRVHGKHDEHWHRAEREIAEQEKRDEEAAITARTDERAKPSAAGDANPATPGKSRHTSSKKPEPVAEPAKSPERSARVGGSPKSPSRDKRQSDVTNSTR